jgi:hypothetical protein
MPYDLKEVAAISGMPGLYRLLKPTRAGVIIETLDAKATRSVASARNKVSLLHEISIYTQDYDQTVPLTEVFDRIHQKYGADLPLSNKSDDRDLTAFMGEIIPDYDRDRVYMSDIKKLVTWYRAVSSTLEYQAPATDDGEALEETSSKTSSEENEPAADEAMSTAGIIPATDEDNADSNPEAGAPKTAKKASKKA